MARTERITFPSEHGSPGLGGGGAGDGPRPGELPAARAASAGHAVSHPSGWWPVDAVLPGRSLCEAARMSRPVPLMESRKLLTAARPPVGEGPSTRTVLRGLREVRPPAPVLLGVALMSLVPLALLGVTVFLAVRLVVADTALFWRLLMSVPVVGTAFLLSALSWRGTKRALHAGQYDDGLFAARLTTIICGVIGAFLLWYVFVDGNEQEDSMLVPFIALALVWLPVLPLLAPSARAWPDRVLLRRGADVHAEEDARLVAAARAHTCNSTPPLMPHQLVPLRDDSGSGWALDWTCQRCGQPTNTLFRLVAPDAPVGVGGGDWMYLSEEGATRAAATDPATAAPERLPMLHFDAWVAVRATEHLLALIPDGKESVPGRRRIGRPFPVMTPVENWTRPVLEQRLAERRATLARVEQEVARRATLSG